MAFTHIERRAFSPTVKEVPTVPTAAVADAFVAARRKEGSEFLKLFLNGVRAASGTPNMDGERVRALVDAAHARGMLAVAHVETVEDVDVALASGVDVLAHVWRQGGFNLELARRVAARRVFAAATLAIPDGFLDGGAALLGDRRLQRFFTDRLRAHLNRTFDPRTTGRPRAALEASLEAHVAAVRSLHQAGVRLLAGTDAAMPSATHPDPGTPSAHGVSLHRELELLLRGGTLAHGRIARGHLERG